MVVRILIGSAYFFFSLSFKLWYVDLTFPRWFYLHRWQLGRQIRPVGRSGCIAIAQHIWESSEPQYEQQQSAPQCFICRRWYSEQQHHSGGNVGQFNHNCAPAGQHQAEPVDTVFGDDIGRCCGCSRCCQRHWSQVSVQDVSTGKSLFSSSSSIF